MLKSINEQTYSVTELIIEEGVGNNNILRNRGFEKSNGVYIFFLDEDCILHPNCLLLLYEQLMKCIVDFTYCNYERTGELSGIQKGKNFDVETLKHMNYISTMSLIKRSIFPGFDPAIKRLQDFDLFLTICENGYKGAWVDQCLFTAIYKKGDISTKGIDDWLAWVNIVKNKHKLL